MATITERTDRKARRRRNRTPGPAPDAVKPGLGEQFMPPWMVQPSGVAPPPPQTAMDVAMASKLYLPPESRVADMPGRRQPLAPPARAGAARGTPSPGAPAIPPTGAAAAQPAMAATQPASAAGMAPGATMPSQLAMANKPAPTRAGVDAGTRLLTDATPASPPPSIRPTPIYGGRVRGRAPADVRAAAVQRAAQDAVRAGQSAGLAPVAAAQVGARVAQDPVTAGALRDAEDMQARIDAVRGMNANPDQYLGPDRPGIEGDAGFWQTPQGSAGPTQDLYPRPSRTVSEQARPYQTDQQAKFGQAMVEAFKTGGASMRGEVERLMRQNTTESWKAAYKVIEDAKAKGKDVARLAAMTPEEREKEYKRTRETAQDTRQARLDMEKTASSAKKEGEAADEKTYKRSADRINYVQKQISNVNAQISQIDRDMTQLEPFQGTPDEKRYTILKKRRDELEQQLEPLMGESRKAAGELWPGHRSAQKDREIAKAFDYLVPARGSQETSLLTEPWDQPMVSGSVGGPPGVNDDSQGFGTSPSPPAGAATSPPGAPRAQPATGPPTRPTAGPGQITVRNQPQDGGAWMGDDAWTAGVTPSGFTAAPGATEAPAAPRRAATDAKGQPLVTITGNDDPKYKAMKPGTLFVDPQGKVRMKPRS